MALPRGRQGAAGGEATRIVRAGLPGLGLACRAGCHNVGACERGATRRRRPRVVTVESDGLITTRTASGRVTNRWPVDSLVGARVLTDRAASSSFSFGLRVASSPVSSLLGMLFGCFAPLGVQELRFSVDSALARDEIVQHLAALIQRA